jgi:ComF family protein
MAGNWREHGRNQPDMIVPVPLHWSRQYKRGYNQAELLSLAVARVLDVPVVRALRRCRRTVQQATLDAQARQRNLSGVFTLKKKETVADRHILVVDDVLTTGATLAHATQVINDAGPATVSVLTAARG